MKKKYKLGQAETTLRSLGVLLIVFLCRGVTADELPSVSGDVILTIGGNIQVSNAESADGERVALFDLELLESLESETIKTSNPWIEGEVVYQGVRMSNLLSLVGADSQSFMAYASDDYKIEVSGVAFEKYPIILAYKQDGEYMGVRDLGPLWIIFPFSDYPELDTEYNRSVSVWQLLRMDVK